MVELSRLKGSSLYWELSTEGEGVKVIFCETRQFCESATQNDLQGIAGLCIQIYIGTY